MGGRRGGDGTKRGLLDGMILNLEQKCQGGQHLNPTFLQSTQTWIFKLYIHPKFNIYKVLLFFYL